MVGNTTPPEPIAPKISRKSLSSSSVISVAFFSDSSLNECDDFDVAKVPIAFTPFNNNPPKGIPRKSTICSVAWEMPSVFIAFPALAFNFVQASECCLEMST